MSGIMETASNFCQNVRVILAGTAGRVAFALLEKAGVGGGAVKEGWEKYKQQKTNKLKPSGAPRP